MNILLIDDEVSESKEFRQGHYMWYYVNALEKHGHSVAVAPTTDKALHWLENNAKNVDLILLDVIMPPGNAFAKHPDMAQGTNTGVLLAQKLLKMYDRIPVVALTHVVTDGIRQNLGTLTNVKCLVDKHECTPYQLVERLVDLNLDR